MDKNLCPLVACATTERQLADRIQAAAKLIGTEFYAAGQLSQVLNECEDRRSLCVVVDHKTVTANSPEVPSQWSRRIPTLVSVSRGDMQAAFQAATTGAVGIIDDHYSSNEIARCLESTFQSESEAKKSGRFDHPVYQHLKDREKSILLHLLAGEPNKRVAAILDIGLRTVEAGRAELMKKLRVKSFAELIAFVAKVEQERFLVRRRIYDGLQATNCDTELSPPKLY